MQALARILGRGVLGAAGVTGLVSGAPMAASAQPAPPSALVLSTDVAPIGGIVTVSGNAGAACAGSSVFDLEFGAVGNPTGALARMSPPVAPDGSWTATFEIPSFVPGEATRGPAFPTLPGLYQFSAPSTCATTPFTFTSAQITITTSAQDPDRYVGIASTPDGGGYWLAQADGAVTPFGDAARLGSLATLGVDVQAPITGIAATPDGKGYWLVGSDGGVFAFGDARMFGSLPGLGVTPSAPVVGIAPTSDGKGYRLAASDGGVFQFGDVVFTPNLEPINAVDTVNSIGAASGGGYTLSSSYLGALVSFPGGDNIGGHVGTQLSASLSGAAFTKDGQGAWQVGLDGGVQAVGDATFEGSLPGLGVTPAAPITAIAASPDGRGYWLLGADGGVFSFGDASFHGSGAVAPAVPVPPLPIPASAPTPPVSVPVPVPVPE